MRELVVPCYVEGRRVQVWYVEYDPSTDSARLGYELIHMPDQQTRIQEGERWFTLEEAKSEVDAIIVKEALDRLEKLRKQ